MSRFRLPVSRSLVLVLALFVARASVASPETPVAPAETPADRDFAAVEAAARIGRPVGFAQMSLDERLLALDEPMQEFARIALKFVADHPADPRRWDAVNLLDGRRPKFFRRDAADDRKVVPDLDARKKFETELAQLQQALLAAADATPAQRERVDWSAFARDFRAVTTAKSEGRAFDYAPFRDRFDAHVARYASLDAALVARAGDYLGALEKNVPGSTETIWRHLRKAPNAALRAKAAEQLERLEARSRPLELAFTAADGRAVDVAKLRGKVVLVDFWATWCGPCLAELPNVKKAYATYRARGFEVIGVALENAKLAPTDTPDQTAAKLARAKQALLDFTTQHDLPWPQHFDGQWWRNDLAVRFEIKAIPATLLLDRDGRIAATNVRGAQLEAELKRLLAP